MAQKQNDTKTAILSIAKDLVKQLGYNAFSYSDISVKLGVKNAAIHYHYPAKEDLLLDIIESYIQEYQIMGKQFSISNIDASKKLQYFIEKYAVLIEQKSICIIGSLASDYYTLPELVREKVLKLIQLVLGMVELTLEEGKNNGIFFFSETSKIKATLIMTNLAAGVQLARITGEEDFKIIERAIVKQLKK